MLLILVAADALKVSGKLGGLENPGGKMISTVSGILIALEASEELRSLSKSVRLNAVLEMSVVIKMSGVFWMPGGLLGRAVEVGRSGGLRISGLLMVLEIAMAVWPSGSLLVGRLTKSAKLGGLDIPGGTGKAGVSGAVLETSGKLGNSVGIGMLGRVGIGMLGRVGISTGLRKSGRFTVFDSSGGVIKLGTLGILTVLGMSGGLRKFGMSGILGVLEMSRGCLLYTSPSPRD